VNFFFDFEELDLLSFLFSGEASVILNILLGFEELAFFS